MVSTVVPDVRSCATKILVCSLYARDRRYTLRVRSTLLRGGRHTDAKQNSREECYGTANGPARNYTVEPMDRDLTDYKGRYPQNPSMSDIGMLRQLRVDACCSSDHNVCQSGPFFSRAGGSIENPSHLRNLFGSCNSHILSITVCSARPAGKRAAIAKGFRTDS